jgi:hypothetical protein
LRFAVEELNYINCGISEVCTQSARPGNAQWTEPAREGPWAAELPETM